MSVLHTFQEQLGHFRDILDIIIIIMTLCFPVNEVLQTSQEQLNWAILDIICHNINAAIHNTYRHPIIAIYSQIHNNIIDIQHIASRMGTIL